MNIYQFIGRNLEITDAMRAYAEEKLARLERFSDQIIDARVVMSYTANGNSATPAKVEVQVNVPHGMVRAEERGVDTYAAIDQVVDKLERQLKRFKGKFIARRNAASPPPPVEAAPSDTAPRIVRTKRHVLRPMTPEDAAVQMEALGHSFFMFRNSETDTISVIYLRNDGNYGLIEPAN